MKNLTRVLFPLFVIAFTLQVQAQNGFTDNFNDSNFTTNPSWSGEVGKFQINASKELQLNNTGATSNNETYLTTSSLVVNDAFWEFYVRLDFDPSSSNFAKVYLVSDQQDLTAALNGYYVQIGGQSGTVDDVRLYRQDGTTDSLLIDGTDGTVASAPAVKIRVTKSASNLWSLFLDQTGTGNSYQLQGTSSESKYNTSAYFGVFCDYTSTRSDKFFFDDFVVSGTAFQDTVAPFVNQVNVLNSQRLEVLFSEKLDSASALDLSNYSLDQSIGNPASVNFPTLDSNKVELNFANSFTSGTTYTLSLQNVKDVSGNTMLPSSSGFFYFIPVPSAYRDVVINELYPDFAPTNGLPESEFVELFNASIKVFDLNGWVLSDGTSNATLGNHILRPGEYLIVCPSTAAIDFLSYGAVQGVTSFPTLNNTGDNITLKDNNGITVDFVNYTESWYQNENKQDGGYTLEQINPFTDCIGAGNFIAANATIGGTPGTINSTFDSIPDQIGPELLRVKVVTKDTILLEFNEIIDTTSIGLATFQFNQNILVDAVYNVKPNFQSIKASLLTPLDSGIVYTVSIDGIKDCNGNGIQNSTETFEFLIPALPTYRDVVINELLPDFSPSVGLPEAEFIELLNASDRTFNLENWVLSNGSTNATLPSQIIKPGEYLILCSSANVPDFQPYGKTVGVSSFPSLTNAGDNIVLKSNNGQTVDFINYTEDWYGSESKKAGGYTLEQINPFTDCNGVSNFIASNASIGGTPGTVNSTFDTLPDLTSPKLIEVLIYNDSTIYIRFDETMDSTSLRNGTYTISPPILVDTILLVAPDYLEATLKLRTKLASSVFYSLTIENASDCSGNLISSNSTALALPSLAVNNDIIVNEILFNSRSGSVDFVEIYNRSEKVISLENWIIANVNDSNVAESEAITENPFLLFPKEYLVLTENKADVIQQYPMSVVDNVIEIADLPSFSDSEGKAYIFNADLELIDEMKYEDDYHFALLVDDDGVSLERINSEKSSLEESNWHSASEKVGFATPGYKNSQDFTNPKSSGSITIEPNIVSPDNDGFQDILSINYQFNAPGFVANVSILDRSGRLIKKLVNNELLGNEGSFFWDGITDENSKARVGIYIVLFEAFNLNGDKEIFKEAITVASQLD
jgi:hypothetical protein